MLKFKLGAVLFAVTIGLSGIQAAAAANWLLVGEHFHTTTDVEFSRDPANRDPMQSYRRDGIEQLLLRGAKIGLDAMIVTEHNSVATCFDSLFTDQSNKVVLICGEEWTTHKSLHLGVLNPPVASAFESYIPTDPGKERSLEEVETEARELVRGIHQTSKARGQDSLVVINHPGFKMYQPHDSLGADAVEALVPDYEDTPRSRLWWLTRLAEGKRMVALGGSDYHACEGWDCVKRGDVFRTLFEEPVNLVLAESPAPTAVMAAIARGRVVALSSIRHKDLRVTLNGDFAGQHYEMGDVISNVQPGETVRLHFGIQGAEGLYAVVYGIGEAKPYKVLEAVELESADFADTLDVVRTGHGQAVHVELFDPIDWNGHADGLPVAISNPIYF